MSEPAKVFDYRGEWRVEWFDDDGRCELEIFTGHDARRQAMRYAMNKYGHFREVQIERSGKVSGAGGRQADMEGDKQALSKPLATLDGHPDWKQLLTSRGRSSK